MGALVTCLSVGVPGAPFVTRLGDRSFLSRTGLRVGTVRFELTTPCSQSRCATRLRHVPGLAPVYVLRGPPSGESGPATGDPY